MRAVLKHSDNEWLLLTLNGGIGPTNLSSSESSESQLSDECGVVGLILPLKANNRHSLSVCFVENFECEIWDVIFAPQTCATEITVKECRLLAFSARQPHIHQKAENLRFLMNIGLVGQFFH